MQSIILKGELEGQSGITDGKSVTGHREPEGEYYSDSEKNTSGVDKRTSTPSKICVIILAIALQHRNRVWLLYAILLGRSNGLCLSGYCIISHAEVPMDYAYHKKIMLSFETWHFAYRNEIMVCFEALLYHGNSVH
jgi:hypothetical protein